MWTLTFHLRLVHEFVLLYLAVIKLTGELSLRNLIDCVHTVEVFISMDNTGMFQYFLFYTSTRNFASIMENATIGW